MAWTESSLSLLFPGHILSPDMNRLPPGVYLPPRAAPSTWSTRKGPP